MATDAEILLLGFVPPEVSCRRKFYFEYVCKRIGQELTLEEIRKLMEHYDCSVDEVADRITDDLMSKATARKKRKG